MHVRLKKKTPTGEKSSFSAIFPYAVLLENTKISKKKNIYVYTIRYHVTSLEVYHNRVDALSDVKLP